MLLVLSGKVAIVTGGSRGIGLETAKVLAENGAQVVITAKDETRLKESESKMKNCIGIPADIRNESQVKNVVEETIKRFGRLDILVNNAGIFPYIKKLHEISEEDWNQVLDVNLTGSFRFTKAAIPFLQKNGGSIINVSSDAGLKAYQGFNVDAYSASKGGPVDVAKAILYFASDDSSWTTGAILAVDGGESTK